MKKHKHLLLRTTTLLCCFFLMSWHGQAQFCETFNQFSNTTPVGTACDAIYYSGLVNNWGGRNIDGISYRDTNSQNGTGDYYLYLDDGGCGNGGTYAFNDVDYSGDWTSMVPQGVGCFCYDLRAFHIQTGTITGYNSLRIHDGTNPGNSTLTATFVISQPIDVSLGWQRTCAPIELSSGGVLPSNADGQWVINTGSAADWDTLITGVRSVSFYVDVASGNELWGIDNICISEDCDSDIGVDPDPTDEGEFCCEDQENLVTNGNFEFGNTGFLSSYTQDPATYPGEYNVDNSAANFGANVTDHSFCSDPVAYPNNDMFLLVNGRTQQPSGSSSGIWGQSLSGLDPEKEYRFCANFKNMPQCNFDILPEITIVTSNGYTHTATINTDPNDPCDWQMESFCFRGSEVVDIRINLAEDGNGDGNDLAIDDISVQAMADSNLSITVQHQGSPQQVTGSINTINTNDDILPYDPEICEDPWYWYVITVDTYSGGVVTFDWSAPYGWGNDTGYSLWNPASSGATPWNLTTNFVPYPFAPNTLYFIGMYTPSCCEDCVEDGFTYQLIFNFLAPMNGGEDVYISEEDKQRILSWLGTYAEGGPRRGPAANDTGEVLLSPNPARGSVQVSTVDHNMQTVTISNVAGQQIRRLVVNNAQTLNIDLSDVAYGVYLVEIETDQNKKFVKKLVVE
ncbi:MAG: T9SS type A sorting domain-containing protein [Bacteroidota bacterium]